MWFAQMQNKSICDAALLLRQKLWIRDVSKLEQQHARQSAYQAFWELAESQLRTKSTGAFSDLRRRSRISFDSCQRLTGLGMTTLEQLAKVLPYTRLQQLQATRCLGHVMRQQLALWVVKYETAPGRITGWGLWSQIFENNYDSWWCTTQGATFNSGLACMWDPQQMAAPGTEAMMIAMNDPFMAIRLQLQQANTREAPLPLALLPTVPKFLPYQPVHTWNREMVLAGDTKRKQLLHTAAKLNTRIWLPPASTLFAPTTRKVRGAPARTFQHYWNNAVPWQDMFARLVRGKSPQEILRVAHALKLSQSDISELRHTSPKLAPLLRNIWTQSGIVAQSFVDGVKIIQRQNGMFIAKNNWRIVNAVVTLKTITTYAAGNIRYAGQISYAGDTWEFDTADDLPKNFVTWLHEEIAARHLPAPAIRAGWQNRLWDLMVHMSPDLQYVTGPSRVGWDAARQALILPQGSFRIGTGWSDEFAAVSAVPLPGARVTSNRGISAAGAGALANRARVCTLYWVLHLYALTCLVNRPLLSDIPPMAISTSDVHSWPEIRRLAELIGYLPPVELTDAASALQAGHDWPILLQRITKLSQPLPRQSGFVAPMPWYAAEVIGLTRPLYIADVGPLTNTVWDVSETDSAAATAAILNEAFTCKFRERYLEGKHTYRNTWLKMRWIAKYALLDAGSSGRCVLRATRAVLQPIGTPMQWTAARAVCRLALKLAAELAYELVIADNTLAQVKTTTTVAVLPDKSLLIPAVVLPKVLQAEAGVNVNYAGVLARLQEENSGMTIQRVPGIGRFWRFPATKWRAALKDVTTTGNCSLIPQIKEMFKNGV